MWATERQIGRERLLAAVAPGTTDHRTVGRVREPADHLDVGFVAGEGRGEEVAIRAAGPPARHARGESPTRQL